MEKKSKKKTKQIKINFDFSDDSGDEFDTPQVFKHTPAKSKHLSLSDEQNNSTIISSEYLCWQAQLPSFTEDIGLPVMDSTHMVVDNNGPKRSVCTDITKIVEACDKDISKEVALRDIVRQVDKDQEKQGKGKENAFRWRRDGLKNHKSNSYGRSTFHNGDGSIHIDIHRDKCKTTERENCHPKSDATTSSNSFVEVEVQDFSAQTSFLGSECVSSNIPLEVPTKQMTSQAGFIEKVEKDVDNSNSSKLPDPDSSYEQCLSSQSSIPCGETSTHRFTTALEDSANLFTEGEFNSSEGLQSKSSVYYSNNDQEFSTDLVDNDSNIHSDCVSASHESSSYYVQDMSLQTSLPFSEMSVSSSNQVFNTHHNSKVKMHASPTSLQSSDTKSSQPQNQHSVVSMNGNSHSFYDLFQITSSAKEKFEDVLAVDSDTNSCPDDDKHNSKDSVIIGDSEDEISKANSPEPSVSIISERKAATPVIDSDKCEEDNDSLDKSVLVDIDSKSSIVKICKEEIDISETKEIDEVTSSLRALSFHQGTSTSQRNRTSSSSSEDNFEAFLTKIKADTNRKEVQEERSFPSVEEFIVDEDLSESEASSQDSDDELFYIRTTNILDKTGKKNRGHVDKSYVCYASSGSESGHDSDSDLPDFIVDDVNRQRKTRYSTEDKDKVKSGNSQQNTLGSLNSPPNEEERDTKTKTESVGKKKSVLKTKSNPSRPKPWPSSITPATKWSSDSDDDFVMRRDDTLKLSLPLPFKTPKPIDQTINEFKTPAKQKVPRSHPWTAPKPLQPSRSSLEDDNTFFLKSLSSDYPSYKRHPEAARYMTRFKSLKEELTTKLFDIFNERVFDSKIPSTISLEWNGRYTKTAGSFSYKRSDLNMSKITLSVKVCDRPERVRDTLIHELCHAAVRLINGANEAHGPVWKSWARKVNRAFPFMPVVARCHDYIIHSKYTYQCVNCKYRISRHSKSLDTETKVCGHCKGEFQVFLTSKLNSSGSLTDDSPRTPRTPNKFALYVKECYSEVKKRNANLKHGDVMKELSREFAEKNKI